MFQALLLLFFAPFIQAQNTDSYSEKLKPLLACYESWCGNEWRAESNNIRFSGRPGHSKNCLAATVRIAQDDVSPLILPPKSSNPSKFIVYLNGSAYSCDVSEVALATCQVEFKREPCEIKDKWELIRFSIPGSNLNIPEPLDLQLIRKPGENEDHFEFNRAVGDVETDRKRSNGKRVCQQSNTTANGKKLQDFIKDLLMKEASKEAFDDHVDFMHKSAKNARKSETTFTEANGSESIETRLARESTFEWAKRIAVHLTQPYSSKSKPIEREEIESLMDLYKKQLKNCSGAKGLESIAAQLTRELEGGSATMRLPIQRLKSVK